MAGGGRAETPRGGEAAGDVAVDKRGQTSFFGFPPGGAGEDRHRSFFRTVSKRV